MQVSNVFSSSIMKLNAVLTRIDRLLRKNVIICKKKFYARFRPFFRNYKIYYIQIRTSRRTSFNYTCDWSFGSKKYKIWNSS